MEEDTMKRALFTLMLAVLCLQVFQTTAGAQTIDQQLVLIQNDGFVGGNFRVAVQVKGTSLSAANTLGTATIDVNFDNTQLTPRSPASQLGTNWAFSILDGYSRGVTNNTTFIRVGVLNDLFAGVNSNEDGTPAGFDIGSSYTTWVQLNFTIASAFTTTSLTIANGSNAISLFVNHGNDPKTDSYYSPTLSEPINLLDQPLPIQLASSVASVIRNNDVEVTWKTVSETNNYGFEVYRKRGDAGEWTKVGFVEGHGTTLAPQSYSYVDRSLSFGQYFYRIKQIDLDGKSETFPEMTVTVGVGPDKFVLAQNYPNPFNPSTLIEFVVPVSGHTSMKVYNILGQEVATLFQGNAEAGKINTARFDASNLPSGLYFYTLRSAGKVETKRMLLMK
jgi:hypothetical protein